MRRRVHWLLVGVAALVLAGCGQGNTPPSDSTPTPAVTASPAAGTTTPVESSSSGSGTGLNHAGQTRTIQLPGDRPASNGGIAVVDGVDPLYQNDFTPQQREEMRQRAQRKKQAQRAREENYGDNSGLEVYADGLVEIKPR